MQGDRETKGHKPCSTLQARRLACPPLCHAWRVGDGVWGVAPCPGSRGFRFNGSMRLKTAEDVVEMTPVHAITYGSK